MEDREETNLSEAIGRIGAGSFYEDYDYAAGPGLRILIKARDAMELFCARVERGDVRSTRTYAQFCEILGREPKPR